MDSNIDALLNNVTGISTGNLVLGEILRIGALKERVIDRFGQQRC